MRLIACTLVVSALTVGAAFAEQAPSAADAARDSTVAPPRTVFICDSDSMTRRAFAREHGRAQFVTAQQAIAKGESWNAPRCVTANEARRLKQMASLRR